MVIPSKTDYGKIQGNVRNYNDVHMSVCGSGCSCPCKQTASINVEKFVFAGACSCNCTCGCNCNAPVLQNHLSANERVFL